MYSTNQFYLKIGHRYYRPTDNTSCDDFHMKAVISGDIPKRGRELGYQGVNILRPIYLAMKPRFTDFRRFLEQRSHASI